ncbi:MAG TPA: recombinase family protein [Myxococcota bacterium]|nr:recombinase family protein [Myxococcota bacterium]
MASATRVVTYYAVPGTGRGASERLAELSRATAEFARARRLVVIEPFVEVRRGRARPELARALARCRDAGAALLVPSLAAVGGDLAFLDALLGARVALLSADSGPARRPVLRLLRDVAHHAQSAASDRSRVALREARRRGVKLGSPRPEIGSRAGVAALRARADAHAEALAPALRELLLSNPGASLRDLGALLEELELPTPRRGRWGPSAVRNALQRAGLRAR